MKLRQEFIVARPLGMVWAYFHDLPRVAASLPGAEYLGEKDGRHLGRVTSKVGPFQASFEGEATVAYDDVDKTIRMEGKGVDRKGASRGKMTMACALAEADGGTKVLVDSDLQLSGTIAQFGRTGLVTEIANVLVADFVRNAEADMGAGAGSLEQVSAANAPTGETPAPLPARKAISGVSLLLLSLKAWIRSWFRKTS